MTAPYAARREKLRKLLHTNTLQALLVSHAANRYYLSGFELHDPQANESAGCLVIMPDGKDWLCTDARYLDAAKRIWDHERIFIYSGNAAKALNTLLKEQVGAGTIGFEAKIVSVFFYTHFSPDLHLKAADGLVESLRVIKSDTEITLLKNACALNHQLMEWVPSVLHPGRTEKDIAWDIEKFFRSHGASELSFSSIVAIGPNAALPHANPAETILTENSPILIDVGCRLDDYCSDQTRSFWVGTTPSPAFQKTMEQVRTAQEKAIAAIRPGVCMAEVYTVAYAYLESCGVAKHFTHGLGHGIGLETHEAPSLNSRNTEALQTNMVVTVEPGLYYPEWGGIRWEYMVQVTDSGASIL